MLACSGSSSHPVRVDCCRSVAQLRTLLDCTTTSSTSIGSTTRASLRFSLRRVMSEGIIYDHLLASDPVYGLYFCMLTSSLPCFLTLNSSRILMRSEFVDSSLREKVCISFLPDFQLKSKRSDLIVFLGTSCRFPNRLHHQTPRQFGSDFHGCAAAAAANHTATAKQQQRQPNWMKTEYSYVFWASS